MDRRTKRRIAGVSLLLCAAMSALLLRSQQIITSDIAAQRRFVQSSRHLTLYSLDPAPLSPPLIDSIDEAAESRAESRKAEEGPAAKDSFHGCRVLGRVEITDPATRAQLLDILYRGVRKEGGWGAMCFAPRHGIRAQSGLTTVDLSICFECSTIAVSSGLFANRISTTGAAQKSLDSALLEAKVPLGSRPKQD